MEYQCSVCGKKIRGDAIVFMDHTQGHIIEEIKRKHPEWVEKNGICRKCFDFYRNQMKG